jgi:nucleoside-diphosphate-sugar epimerase
MTPPRSKVLVCGATGFIGRNLCERLAARADLEVTGVWNRVEPPPGMRELPGLRLVRADLTDRNQVESVVAGQEIILQAAAVTSGAKDITTRPYIHVTDNAVMNALLMRAAFEHHARHFLFFSCSVMYPSGPLPVRETDFNFTMAERYHASGWTKVYHEKMCEFYARLGRARYTVIRHSNIYGPHDKYDLERSHFFGATITKVLTARDGRITVWGDGSEARDLLHVSDLVDFVELALARQTDPFELVNIGAGVAVPVRDLVRQIVAASGRALTVEFDTSKPSIPFSLALECGRAREKYGWTPRIPLDAGIRSTLDWYRQNKLGGEKS